MFWKHTELIHRVANALVILLLLQIVTIDRIECFNQRKKRRDDFSICVRLNSVTTLHYKVTYSKKKKTRDQLAWRSVYWILKYRTHAKKFYLLIIIKRAERTNKQTSDRDRVTWANSRGMDRDSKNNKC